MVKVLTKINVLVFGQFYEPGQVIEFDEEIWNQIDDVVKLVAFEEVEDGEVGN